MFDLKPCPKCGGEGVERIGPGFPAFMGGVRIPALQPFGTYIVCRSCGYRRNSFSEPWEAIRDWNGEPMIYDLEQEEQHGRAKT